MESQIEWTFALCLFHCSLLLTQCIFIGTDNSLRVKVFEFIVLRHESCQYFRECLDLRCQFQLLYETLSVLLKLFRLNFLVSIDLINSSIKLCDVKFTLLVLHVLVVRQVFHENLGSQLIEGSSENMRFVLEELIYSVLVLHIVEDVSCKIDHILQRFVQVVAL